MRPFILLLFLIPAIAAAQTPLSSPEGLVLVYSDTTTYIETSRFAAVLEDVNKEWSIAQVMALPDSCFNKARPGRLNLGNSASRFWVRYFIDNRSSEELYFFCMVAMMTHIDLYTVSADGQLQANPPGGTARQFENRSLPIAKPNFKLGKTPQTVYVAIESNQSLMFPNYIGAKDAIYTYQRLDERVSFFCCGVYFILALFNFVFFFTSRDRPYLWYSLYELGTIFYMLHVAGYGYQFLWRAYPFINMDANFHPAVVVLPACFFSMSFLNTHNVLPKYDLYLKVLIGCYSGALLLQLLGFSLLSNTLCQLLILVIYFSLWAAGVLAYIKKQRTARFYVIGWTIYLFSVILYMLGEARIMTQLQDFVGNYYLLHIGAVTEGCFLAFALADRLREIRAQARDANAMALHRALENEALMAKQTLLIEEKLQLEQQQNNSVSDLPALIEQMKTERSKNTRLHIPTADGTMWIPTQDIVRLEAMRSYCSIYTTNGKRFIASHPLSDFEKQLDAAEFMRVHKSHLVNLSQIQEYLRGEGGTLVLKDGSSVSVSRTAKALLNSHLNPS